MIHEDHPAPPNKKRWIKCAMHTGPAKPVVYKHQLSFTLFALRQIPKENASHNWSSSTISWISSAGSHLTDLFIVHPSGLPWNSKASLRWFAPQSVAAVVKSPRASESPIPVHKDHKGEQLGVVSTKSWSQLVMQPSNIIPEANGFGHKFSIQAVWTASSLIGRTELTPNFFSQSCFGAF